MTGFFLTFRSFLRRFRYTVSWQGFFLCGFSVILYNVCFKKYKILLYGRHPYFHNFDLGALAEVLKNPYRHDMFRVRRIWLRLLGSTHSLWIVAVSYYSCPTELFWLLNIKNCFNLFNFLLSQTIWHHCWSIGSVGRLVYSGNIVTYICVFARHLGPPEQISDMPIYGHISAEVNYTAILHLCCRNYAL